MRWQMPLSGVLLAWQPVLEAVIDSAPYLLRPGGERFIAAVSHLQGNSCAGLPAAAPAATASSAAYRGGLWA